MELVFIGIRRRLLNNLMNIAILPSVDEQLNDRYFKDGTEDNSVSNFFVKGLRREIRKRGDEIHTIDYYKDLSKIDFVLLDWPRWDKIAYLLSKGLLPKTIYSNAEPTSVISYNCPEGYKKLRRIFPYILTWNDEWVDKQSIFKKTIPYPFYVDMGDIAFEDKKLLTAITADKKSDIPGELYSERARVYTWFENNRPDDFEFYGIRWKKEEHPGYKGTVEDKLKVYHNYKFAICLENTRGDADYVTEKIYDCLCAGIIPIYGGAKNIKDYVPENCYIDYFKFSSYEEMADYLTNMPKEEYEEYRKAIKDFLDKVDLKAYDMETYVNYLYEIFNAPKNFKVPFGDKLAILSKGLKEKIWIILVDIKHALFSHT